MSFRENLQTKIRLDNLAAKISQSIGTQAGAHKLDKEAVTELLMLSPYAHEKRRDLELYYRPLETDIAEVLVLDNELPLYTNTTLEDVTLRRSPELKEMISIRNVIKILNDSDILLCKGQQSVQHVHDRAVERLDLRYEKADIDGLVDEAKDAFLSGDVDAVFQVLQLFIEILGYEFVPAEFSVNNCAIFGPCERAQGSAPVFRYVILYNEKSNELKWVNHRLETGNPTAQELIYDVAEGIIPPDVESVQVLHFLADEALTKKVPTLH